MPCDHTRNHAWHVAHHISLRTRQTHWCKCGKRMTVDDVHFECRFMKPLWEIIAQANVLSVNSFVPQTQQTFLEGTLFQLPFGRMKDTWSDIAHSVVCMQAWGRWVLCNDIITKAIPLSQQLAQCAHLARHANTDKLVKLARIHRL